MKGFEFTRALLEFLNKIETSYGYKRPVLKITIDGELFHKLAVAVETDFRIEVPVSYQDGYGPMRLLGVEIEQDKS